GSVVSKLVHARSDSCLHSLTYCPVLTVDEIPKVRRIGWVKSRFLDFARMKKKVANNAGPLRSFGRQHKCGNVVATDTQQHVRINQLAKMPDLLFFGQRWKGVTRRGSGLCICVGPVPVRNASWPVQIRASGAFEYGYHFAKFRVDGSAVVA